MPDEWGGGGGREYSVQICIEHDVKLRNSIDLNHSTAIFHTYSYDQTEAGKDNSLAPFM